MKAGKFCRWLTGLCLAVAALSWTPVGAHHSFTAVYRIDEVIEIEGEVAQFQFRNPHVLIHILVPDENGEKARWAAEWLNVTQLALSGVSAQTFRPGDAVTITGNPGRIAAEHRIRVHTITRLSDGFRWGSPEELGNR